MVYGSNGMGWGRGIQGCLASVRGVGILLALTTGAVLDRPVTAAQTGNPWQDMDYGPFLTASIAAPQPAGNLAYKGIAIQLGRAGDRPAKGAMLFDTDLLRYAAGWTGGYVALRGVVFDGEHWAHPQIEGEQAFGNPNLPGWARGGAFEDPREHPYGPIPRDWAHWKGLTLHGQRVILNYTVGDMSVNEMPGLESSGGIAPFVRTFNVGPSTTDQRLQVAFEAGRRAEVRHLNGAAGSVAVLAEPGSGHERDRDRVLMAVVVGAPAGSRWETNAPGHLRWFLPAAKTERRFKVLLWRGPQEQAAAFAAAAASAAPAEDLRPLTQGGPARWPEKLQTRGRLGAETGPYAIDTLTPPDDNPWRSWLRFGGLDFFSDTRRAAICTWNGDVWVVDGVDGNLEELTWQRIATGLFQPLGLKIVDDQIYVLGRDQITRLHDLNGDGEADFYENFNNDCMVSEHFHEFATDLKTDSAGNFWYVKCACHAVQATHPHHGTVLKLSPDGARLEVVARGLRAVNGLGIGPNDEVLCVDNEGHWLPGNRINWVRPGGWYGNQLAWNPDDRRTYDEPLCWMHNSVDRSGGTFLWVPDRRWGALDGQILSISYGMGYLTLVLTDEVDGVMQGGVTRLPMEFDTGVMRGVFHPVNGQLYTCGLYGWAGNKTRPGGFYRVRYTGRPLNLPNRLEIARDGIVIGFTDPLDPIRAADPGNYHLQAWNYRWTANYGSPTFRLNGEEGRDTWTVAAAAVSADRRTVFLQVPKIQPVMQTHLVFNLQAADGAPVRNFIHGTIHRLGPRPGIELIGAAAVTEARAEAVRLETEAPGLLQTLSSLDHPALPDTRVVRLAATYVAEDASPSPWLPEGRFRSVWRGYLSSDLNDEIRFQLAGRGQATLRLNDQAVLQAGPGHFDDPASLRVPVRRGPNAFELEYVSPEQGDAVLRLSWESPRIPLEPVPATAFVHDASLAEARRAVALREGRALFGEHLCARCHQPESEFPHHAMPELHADAPSLDDLGGRLNADWIAHYLVDPKATQPDGRMPRVLVGAEREILRDASDIAAFLTAKIASGPDATLERPKLTEPSPGGAWWFAELGCVACHRLAGDPELSDDPRLSLAHLPAKWRPDALAAFLLQPNRHYGWTRMPAYALTEEQARVLADHLLAQGGSWSRPAPAWNGPPDPRRGSERVESYGCLACHTLTGHPSTPRGPRLEELAVGDGQTGCLADETLARGAAPDFAFTTAQREALRSFIGTDGIASLQRQSLAEFAGRQYQQLRCNACHARDGQPDVWTQVSALAAAAPIPAQGRGEAGGVDGGSVHVGRPVLSFAGEKLHAEWMERFLTGRLQYKPRSQQQGVMPAFPAQGEALAKGLAHEHGYGAEPPIRLEPDPELAELGRRLTLVGDGFGCVACHDVGAHRALAGEDTATINFAFVVDRLLPEYYQRYLRDPQRLAPGTMMPAYVGADGNTPIAAVYDGDPERQFTAIWHYLLSLEPDAAQATSDEPSAAGPAPTPVSLYE